MSKWKSSGKFEVLLGGSSVHITLDPHPLGWAVKGWTRKFGEARTASEGDPYLEQAYSTWSEAVEAFRAACQDAVEGVQPMVDPVGPMLMDVDPGSQKAIDAAYSVDKASS